MKIVIDAFGGDYAPREIVAGAVKALQANEKLELVLVGDKDKITEILQDLVFVSDRLEIVHAPDVVTMNDVPTVAIRTKKTSSIVVAYDYLKNNDDAVALISAGSTGATLAGSVLKLGRIKGISRPALAPLLPTVNDGNVMLLDCGANAECKAENLLHFAIMGNEYMKAMGIKKPKIALLNIGTEEEKGSEMIKEAYELLKNSNLNFVGNIEARDVMKGMVDVVVADGFSGNICLKTIEGTAEILFGEIKDVTHKSLKTKIGALMLKKGLYGIKKKYDYRKVGGAPMLGVNKIVLKCHGNSKADSIETTIHQAYELANNNLIEKVRKAVSKNEE
ncbi:MAG: phosphate acyltransferase PlsX [Clostridiales bacterium]|nr:phosphate acyltransferase PlsX [Clostridiales bacterium]